MQKIKPEVFVLDTSVLIHDDNILNTLDGSIVLPIEVLEELDKLKVRNDAVGSAARHMNRNLDELRLLGNLYDGVEYNGKYIRVSLESDLNKLPSQLEKINDNRIISVAYRLHKRGFAVTLLSRDVAMRVKCDSMGIKALDYNKDRIVQKKSGVYTGNSTIECSHDDMAMFYETGKLDVKQHDLHVNHAVVLKCEKASALAIVDKNGIARAFKYWNKNEPTICGMRPKNKEQQMALELLLNPDIAMVTMTGMAGSGKTLLAIAAALHMLDKGMYGKIVISRPAESMSNDIGFLPGTKSEKLLPWVQPIFDNIKVLLKNSDHYIKVMLDKGIIEMESLSYIRGRTFPNTVLILDEAQNINHHEAKAVITRMGEKSKLIMIGDLEQIDCPKLDMSSSGLSAVIDKFRDCEIAAHVSFTKGERSALAAYAAKVM